jgi:PEP-CTERM motif
LNKASLALIALTVGLFSASQAKASTLDSFVLTGDGNTFTFSLISPSNPADGYSCPGHSFSNFCYGGVSVTDNGHAQTDTVEFSSDGDINIFNSHGQSVLELTLNSHQSLFYTENKSGIVTFLDGTFHLSGNDNGFGNDDWNSRYDCDHDSAYTLVLDPPTTSPVPEPSSLALMSSGVLAAAGAVRRRLKK